MMASVSGSRSVTVDPKPGWLAISMLPRKASTLRRTTSMPTPRPETSETACAVEKPGSRTKAKISDSLSRASAADQPLLHRTRPHRLAVNALAVVGNADQNLRPGMARRKMNRARRWLARGPAHFRQLNAVIHAVADQVHQRIIQLVEHGLIQLRLSALEGEFHFFVQAAPQVVDQAFEALEGRS